MFGSLSGFSLYETALVLTHPAVLAPKSLKTIRKLKVRFYKNVWQIDGKYVSNTTL
jgi:hypothetical protein